jgi:hypothetical protein
MVESTGELDRVEELQLLIFSAMTLNILLCQRTACGALVSQLKVRNEFSLLMLLIASARHLS